MRISDDEKVARILSSEWVENGRILQTAFQLRAGETYLSVNRPAIDTYIEDIRTFVTNHSTYCCHGEYYRRALLNVGDIREIKISHDALSVAAEVEVEPRNIHIRSHAGIFTRYKGRNLKQGQLIKASGTGNNVSTDSILLELRYLLRQKATLEKCLLQKA